MMGRSRDDMAGMVGRHCRKILLGVALVCGLLSRGETPGPPGALPGPDLTEDGVTFGGGEDRRETIAKCLADLGSGDVEARVRAVMILGKYPEDDRALTAVVSALDDKEARVRRAAVVSLGEDQRPVPEATGPLVLRLADQDVQVRRLASSLLPRILSFQRVLILTPGVRPRPDPGIDLSPGSTEVVKRAFADQDPVVRKNMIACEAILGDVIGPDEIVPLLSDDSAETRVLAIAALRRRTENDNFAKLIAPLAADPDPNVRTAVARQLVLGRREGANVVPILSSLVDDRVATVAAQAVEGLFMLGQPIDMQRFFAIIDSEQVNSQMAVRLISLFPVQGADFKAVMDKLISHSRADFRAAALRGFSRARGTKALSSPKALELLADPSQNVRRQAARIVYVNRDVAKEQLLELLDSRYSDVKEFILSASRMLKPEDGRDVLMELLIDEHAAIRAQALSEYARRRYPDAAAILGLSLADDDRTIQAAAISGLTVLRTAEAGRLLREFAETTDDRELANMARIGVSRAARPPIGNRPPVRRVAPNRPGPEP